MSDHTEAASKRTPDDAMTAVWAYCRNGDRHFGHLDGWGDGFAVIGGTRIDGVVFTDAIKIESGGFVPDDTSRPATGDDDATRCVAVPAALPSDGPVDAPSITDGQGKSTGSPLYGCRCGHSRHEHGPYAHCRHTGCLCDSYRSATTNAASHAGPAAL